MENLEKLVIDIFSLKNEVYDYTFEVNDSFFSLFENSLIQEGNFIITLVLSKSENMIILDFDIKGKALLTCDRSLEKFWHKLTAIQKIVLKFGESAEFVTEELEIIPRNTTSINISQYAYEFISLSIPQRKIHPKFENDDPDDELIYSSGDFDDKENKENTTENDSIDPRWEGLKKIKDK